MENESFLENLGREPNSELKRIISSLGKLEKDQITNILTDLKSGKLFDNKI